MDYGQVVSSVCMYVENRVRKKISYNEMARVIGLSYRRIREVFEANYEMTLARYILTRRLSNAAFNITHTNKSLIDIAFEYGFDEYNTFSRAFKRIFGITPMDFRKDGHAVGRQALTQGVFAPVIPCEFSNTKTERTDNIMSNECILLGVPHPEFGGLAGSLPFPIVLRNCLNYMGQQIDQSFILTASCAAFNMRWNLSKWDEGQHDIQLTYKEPYKVFERGFQAAGRSYKMLKRDDSDKDGFKSFIREEIKAGRPVIALGIVGPPEACIIAGYKDDGDTLLGWSLFQKDAAFKKGVRYHENGYFITKSWWENKCTTLLMSIGEEQKPLSDDADILRTALEVMTHDNFIASDDEKSEIACGQAAYNAWAKRIDDDTNFAPNQLLPLLRAKYACHQDGQIMVGAGRQAAIEYLKSVRERHPEVSELCDKASAYLNIAFSAVAWEMHPLMSQDKRGMSHEKKLTKFAERETRTQLVGLIRKAQENDYKAQGIIEKIVRQLEVNA
ncbi:MAG: helix-turn-helix transcriptional regulator [Defluviitaleaceae bacterium]|nr:helix-turn-helix transcriptional regulator [Defluviitaleaceae bacterium]